MYNTPSNVIAMQSNQPDAPANRVTLLEYSHVLCRRRTNSMHLNLSRRGERGRVLSVTPFSLERGRNVKGDIHLYKERA